MELTRFVLVPYLDRVQIFKFDILDTFSDLFYEYMLSTTKKTTTTNIDQHNNYEYMCYLQLRKKSSYNACRRWRTLAGMSGALPHCVLRWHYCILCNEDCERNEDCDLNG